MKNRKIYLLRGLLVLLAAALVLAAALPGLGLSTGGPTPLPQAQADPLRPEGQSQSPQTPPDQPEEPDTPRSRTPSMNPRSRNSRIPRTSPTSRTPPGPGHPARGPRPGPGPGRPAQGRRPPGRHPRRYRSHPRPLRRRLPRIVTDLCSGEITYDQLTGDTLHFYAYILNANGQTLKVKLHNSQTSQNGQYLTADGRNYQARLCRGETNYFTLYRKDGNKTVQEVNYAIRYAAQKADERHPTIGDHPPTIVTNLEGVTETTNRNFTLTVQATAYTGRSLPESNIQVYLDGKQVLQPTGNPVFEYQLRFPDPFSGDSEAHTISIRAWDGQGNSRYVSYRIIYRFVDTGDVIGTAYVVLDITTMGMGLPEEPLCRSGAPERSGVLRRYGRPWRSGAMNTNTAAPRTSGSICAASAGRGSWTIPTSRKTSGPKSSGTA
ncbi:MAG: hypothetical protein ACLR5H_13940 [Oscillospiraceae bacterium]